MSQMAVAEARKPAQSTQAAGGILQRKCDKCRKKKPLLQRAADGPAPETVPPIVHEVLRSPGQPLDASTRAFMELRFGHDFSRVRVHTDAKAAESARAVNALAYTVGRNVVFATNQYVPHSSIGQELIAHELTHVVQQTRAGAVAMQRQAASSVQRSILYDQPAEFRDIFEASFAAGRRFGCPGCDDAKDAASCFNHLDPGARFVLTSLYNRFNRFGLWEELRYIEWVGTSFVGGARFSVNDHRSFFNSLLTSGSFCLDTASGRMLHRGSTSLREISTGDSMHLQIGARNIVSAHIDAISPVAGKDIDGFCRYEPASAAAHIGREVVPLAIPGLRIFPEPQPTFGLPKHDATPPEIIRLDVFRF